MTKKKHILQLLMVSLALTATVLILHFHSAARPVNNSSPSCKESMSDCKKDEKSSKMIWEGLSQQFFSSI